MPSLEAGMAICLQGNASEQGTEHNTAHQGDQEVVDSAQGTDNGFPAGILPLKDALALTMQAAINAKPQCEEEIRKKMG